jgi:hypothetical protein
VNLRHFLPQVHILKSNRKFKIARKMEEKYGIILPATQPTSHAVNQPANQTTSQSASHPFIQPASWTGNQPATQPTIHAVNQPTSKSQLVIHLSR